MSRINSVLFAVSLATLLFVPAGAQAQSQDIADLRRRVDDVERQLFQQRLGAAPTSHDPSVARLQQRLDQLERDLSAQRISDIASQVTSKGSTIPPQVALARSILLAEKVDELEKARAADAKIIEKLTARIEALEKAAKPPVRRRQ